MTTWNHITVQHAPAEFTLDALPDGLSVDGEIWEDRDDYDERPAVEAHTDRWGRQIPARVADPEGKVTISGYSKWHADQAEAAMIELSRQGATVTWSESWDDDGMGRRTTVYVGGEVDRAASLHDEDVPENLDELIEAVRAAQEDASADAQARRDSAAAALCEALRPQPEGAR